MVSYSFCILPPSTGLADGRLRQVVSAQFTNKVWEPGIVLGAGIQQRLIKHGRYLHELPDKNGATSVQPILPACYVPGLY